MSGRIVLSLVNIPSYTLSYTLTQPFSTIYFPSSDVYCLAGLSFHSLQTFDVLFSMLGMATLIAYHSPVHSDVYTSFVVVFVSVFVAPVSNNPTRYYTIIYCNLSCTISCTPSFALAKMIYATNHSPHPLIHTSITPSTTSAKPPLYPPSNISTVSTPPIISPLNMIVAIVLSATICVISWMHHCKTRWFKQVLQSYNHLLT